MDGESIYGLIEAEGVTYSAAVPTVWQMLLTYMQENGKRFTTLERVTIGGSACPESIIRAFRDDYGVDVIQGWGRSEEHTSELQSLMRISYAVFCLKQNRTQITTTNKYRTHDKI